MRLAGGRVCGFIARGAIYECRLPCQAVHTARWPVGNSATLTSEVVGVGIARVLTIGMPHDDAPVLKQLNAELLVAYVIDTGDSFVYIQNRDVHTDSVNEAELHAIGIGNLSVLAASGQLRVAPNGDVFAALLGWQL